MSGLEGSYADSILPFAIILMGVSIAVVASVGLLCLTGSVGRGSFGLVGYLFAGALATLLASFLVIFLSVFAPFGFPDRSVVQHSDVGPPDHDAGAYCDDVLKLQLALQRGALNADRMNLAHISCPEGSR